VCLEFGEAVRLVRAIVGDLRAIGCVGKPPDDQLFYCVRHGPSVAADGPCGREQGRIVDPEPPVVEQMAGQVQVVQSVCAVISGRHASADRSEPASDIAARQLGFIGNLRQRESRIEAVSAPLLDQLTPMRCL
jgi:hypothetical protein